MDGDVVYGPWWPPTPATKGTMLLSNNWFALRVTRKGIQCKKAQDREWIMTPIGANSEWNAKHEDEMYGKPFDRQINNHKNRRWYRILDPKAPAKPLPKETPELNAFKLAKRMVHQWDDEILDFKYGSMPLHGPLRGWLVDSPYILDDGEWHSPDAWKTRPLAQSAELKDTPAGKRLLDSAEMFKMTCSAEELAAANKEKERRAAEKEKAEKEKAKRQKLTHS